MAAVINTNVSSLNAQLQLSKTQSAMDQALERLNSGKRINGAKDDAAGIAIVGRMTAQIQGMATAMDNANDGYSMAEAADKQMASLGDTLLKMRDLAEKAANGSKSASDRVAYQQGMDELFAEIDRQSGAAEFNGVKLLNGTAKNVNFQIGAYAGETISFSIGEVNTKSMSLNSSIALGDLNGGRMGTVATEKVKINGKEVTMASEATAKAVADKLNTITGDSGVKASAYNSVSGKTAMDGKTDGTLSVNGTAVKASANMSELVDNINKAVGGVTASIGNKGELVISNDTGDDIVIAGAATTGNAGAGLVNATNKGYVSLKSNDGSAVKIENGTNLGFNDSTGSSSVKGQAMVSASNADASASIAHLNATQGKLTSSDTLTINGVNVDTTNGIGASAAEKAAAINAIKDQTGVVATAKTEAYLTIDPSAATGDPDEITINGTSVSFDTSDDNSSIVQKINDANVSGVVATADTNTGRIKLTAASGNDLVIGAVADTVTGVATKADGTGGAVTGGQFVAVRGQLSLEGENGATVTVGGTAGTSAKLGLVDQGGAEAVVGGKLSVSTQAQAMKAMESIDRALDYVNSQRSTMGATMNRLTATRENLSDSKTALEGALSRIQDLDFAKETANMTKLSILMQAGTAMLAQANSQPNMVLSLLK